MNRYKMPAFLVLTLLFSTIMISFQNCADSGFTAKGSLSDVADSTNLVQDNELLSTSEESEVIPLVISQQPISIEVKLGQSATFLVMASGSGNKYAWYRIGSDRVLSTDQTLDMKNVTKESEGSYFVLVSRDGQQTISHLATLSILTPDQAESVAVEPQPVEEPPKPQPAQNPVEELPKPQPKACRIDHGVGISINDGPCHQLQCDGGYLPFADQKCLQPVLFTNLVPTIQKAFLGQKFFLKFPDVSGVATSFEIFNRNGTLIAQGRNHLQIESTKYEDAGAYKFRVTGLVGEPLEYSIGVNVINPLAGKWEKPRCEAGIHAYTQTSEYHTDGTYHSIRYVYDTRCQYRVFSIEMWGVYNLGGIYQGEGSCSAGNTFCSNGAPLLQAFNYSRQRTVIKPLGSYETDIINSWKTCGLSDWKNGEARDMTANSLCHSGAWLNTGYHFEIINNTIRSVTPANFLGKKANFPAPIGDRPFEVDPMDKRVLVGNL